MKKLLVLLAAGAFVLGLTLPAMSADWSFYGSSRLSTFFDSDSEEVNVTGYDDDDLTWSLQGNSRIGARVKAGNIGGGFEYGHGTLVQENSSLDNITHRGIILYQIRSMVETRTSFQLAVCMMAVGL